MADSLIGAQPAYDPSDEYRPEPKPAPQPSPWLDGSFRIGIHTSIAGDIASALDSAAKLGANALQIFSASPRMWPRAGSRIADADAARFRARRTELGLGPLVVHDNYLINLACPDRVMRAKSIQAFHDELVRAVALGADYLVAHPGSGLGSIINPKLILEAGPPAEFFEGCLSIGGFGAVVPRSRRVRVECWNEKAELGIIRATGWYSRILQHEIDHLNGTLYIDRMRPRSFSTADNHQRFA